MSSAILMAGYNNKRTIKKYSKMVAENYGEKFIETGYKPLREFTYVENGKEIKKPVIQFVLEKLIACDRIDEIIIVGHQMLIEQCMSEFINKIEKPCKIVNQNSRIPKNIIDQFNIIPKKIKFNSLAGNIIKGYVASAAYNNRDHALFIASDSPLTSQKFIGNFILIAEEYKKDSAIILPAVYIDETKDRLGRKTVKLLNDTPYQISDKNDDHGRQGFRISSLVYLNPDLFDVNSINTSYNLRKWMNPNVQLKLFRATHNLGYSNVYSKYFIKKNLSIRECENIGSAFFGGPLSLIPMDGEMSTYDYDGTEKEYRGISEMLKNEVPAEKS